MKPGCGHNKLATMSQNVSQCLKMSQTQQTQRITVSHNTANTTETQDDKLTPDYIAQNRLVHNVKGGIGCQEDKST